MTIVLVVIALAVLALLAVAATRPAQFRVQRSVAIAASPDKVFPFLESFSQWSRWSPWEKLDPTMKRQYSGTEKGVGAGYYWVGNKQVGEGRMAILESVPPSQLVVQLDFIKPFAAHNTAQFDVLATEQGCEVTWAMFGPSPFISKLMGLFFNMDQMIGKDFESGLANLKRVAEQA